MTNVFEEAKSLHSAGQLEEAVALYQQAAAVDSENKTVWNMLGNALFDQRELSAAVTAYRRALEIDPSFAPAHFNLGNALFDMDLRDDAIAEYQTTIGLVPEMAVAHFNLGNAFFDLGRYEDAVVCYREALRVSDPPDPDFAYNLGKSLSELDRFEEAAAAYTWATQIDPQFFRAHSNLALTLFELSRVEEAVQAHYKAIEVNPTEASEHFWLGRSLMTLARMDDAAAEFRRALDLNPMAGPAYEALGRILYTAGRHSEVSDLLAEWDRATPGNARAEHMRAAWTGEGATERASDGYVRSVFDNFATTFDDTLRKLQYRAPTAVAEAVAKGTDEASPRWEILDLGCGTGLCGIHLKPYALRLMGVDLSPPMLEFAEGRGIYDQLVAAEITEFLINCHFTFDVIASADTLVYFGDLSAVLALARRVLRPNGKLVFTLEKATPEQAPTGYWLTPTGRYAHTESYVREMLTAHRFAVESIDSIVLREEAGQQVDGWLVTAR